MSRNIPLIDVSKCGLLQDDCNVDKGALENIGKQLYDVLSTSGFAYLSNHGIPMQKVESMNDVAANFFALLDEEKRKFETKASGFSYDPVFSTRADMKHGDFHEGIRITGEAHENDHSQWPNVPSFRKKCVDLVDSCKLLIWRLLKALGVGMKLKDPEYFFNAHSLMNRKGNSATLKTVHYPPVLNEDMLSENQMRLGEHTDWTTLVFLFQDNVGGLQVKTEHGDFVDVTPIPGTIVLNVGEVLQKWSGGRLKATVHRVIPPENPEKRKQIRRSIVYFGQANDDVPMESLKFADNSLDKTDDDEKSVTVGQYIAMKYRTYIQMTE